MDARIKYAPPGDMEADIYENSVIFGLTEIVPDRDGDVREPYGYDPARHRFLARTKSEGIHGLLERDVEELWDLAERRVWADAWLAGNVALSAPGAPEAERPFVGGNREW